MKKFIFLLIFILALAGCATLSATSDQNKQFVPQATEIGKMSPESIQELLKFLENTGTNKIRAFTGRTGGTAGALDSISVSSLSNNDLGLVFDVSDSTMYFYKFVSAATDSEVDPYFIRPDDYSSAGVWYLMVGFGFARSATPQWVFRDSACTDYDDNARIYVDCTDTGSGTEDCDLTIAVQIAGNETDIITIDADGAVTLTSLASQTPQVDDPDNWTVSGNYLYGGIFIATTGAGTMSLPAVSVGMNFTVISEVAAVVTIDPNSADTIYLDGSAETQDETIVSSGAAGDMVVCTYRSANAWSCNSYHFDGGTD